VILKADTRVDGDAVIGCAGASPRSASAPALEVPEAAARFAEVCQKGETFEL